MDKNYSKKDEFHSGIFHCDARYRQSKQEHLAHRVVQRWRCMVAVRPPVKKTMLSSAFNDDDQDDHL